MKLLIVDDSAMIRRSISSAYKGTIFSEIQTASDGLLAVTIFKQFLPDVVTLDITMPHMDGLAALSQMLKIKPDVRVLVISALADNHTAIESLIRGAEQFICKPFTPEDLKSALDELVEDGTKEKTSSNLKELTQTDEVVEKLNLTDKVKEEPSNITQTSAPSSQDYPSGYVIPPRIKAPVSLASYADEVLSKRHPALTF